MNTRLIINADDYGRTPEVSHGIRYAHLHGVVTSTTCMMNIPSTAEDIKIALRETPALKMGVHLVLTAEKPILPREQVTSLVDANGFFLKYDAFIAHLPQLELNEVKAEWRAQVKAFITATGRKPTHLDSHHHSSYFRPELFEAMLELAKEYECPIRFPSNGEDDPLYSLPPESIRPFKENAPRLLEAFKPRRPDTFISNFYDERVTQEELLSIINALPEGTHELMCHPGYVDDVLLNASIYNRQRGRELEILTSETVKEAIRARRIELISFADL